VSRLDHATRVVLDALGLSAGGTFSEQAVHAECIRIARRLRLTERRVVGLMPIGANVAVPPIGVRLGLAQVQLSGSTVAYVDANVRLPALPALAGSADDDGASIYATRWILDSLALLTPPSVESAGQVIPQLALAIEDGADLFHYMYVDLTGFDLIGEHAEASSLMDAVIAIGRAGQTKETDLLHYRDQLGTSNFLGILLVG
jgi:hypothetical protein